MPELQQGHQRAGLLGSFARGRWAGVALAMLVLLALGPGQCSMPVVDRDEARFAIASRTMLESGDWIVPRVGDRARLNKPPLIYWLQAISAGALGADPHQENSHGLVVGGIGSYRFPSLLLALCASLLTWRLGRSIFGTDDRGAIAAWSGGLFLGVGVLVMWDARQARSDQLLLAVTTASMWALWEVWKRSRSDEPVAGWRSVVLWLLVGTGVMSKGPITPMIVLVTALAMSVATGSWRWWRSLRLLGGFAIVVALASPWVIAVGAEIGWSHYLETITDEVFGRSVSAQEGHFGPPGYHLVLLPLMLWPGSLLTAMGVATLWRSARAPRDAPTGETGTVLSRIGKWLTRWDGSQTVGIFLLAWIIPSWIVFELVTTKLPHYVLPIYPALALASGWALAGIACGDADLRARSRRPVVWASMIGWWCVGLIALIGGSVGLWIWGQVPLALHSIVALAFGAAAIAISGAAILRGRVVRAQFLAVAVVLLIGLGLMGGILPGLRKAWISSAVTAIVHDLDPGAHAPIGAVGYREQSLRFLLGDRLEDTADPNTWLSAEPGRILLAAGIQDPPGSIERGSVTGFNYSTGDRVNLRVLTMPESGR